MQHTPDIGTRLVALWLDHRWCLRNPLDRYLPKVVSARPLCAEPSEPWQGSSGPIRRGEWRQGSRDTPTKKAYIVVFITYYCNMHVFFFGIHVYIHMYQYCVCATSMHSCHSCIHANTYSTLAQNNVSNLDVGMYLTRMYLWHTCSEQRFKCRCWGCDPFASIFNSEMLSPLSVQRFNFHNRFLIKILPNVDANDVKISTNPDCGNDAAR